MADTDKDAQTNGTNQAKKLKKTIRSGIYIGGGLLLFGVITFLLVANFSGTEKPKAQQVAEQSTPTYVVPKENGPSQCANFNTAHGESCIIGRTRTGWIPTGGVAGQRPCFGPAMTPDGPYEAWYLADGVKYHWEGTEADKGRKPTAYSFRAKYSDQFTINYGLCPA